MKKTKIEIQRVKWKAAIVGTIISILITLCIVSCNHSSTKRRDKPNIIYLMTDDQSSHALGVMGNKYIITPNLDQLARDGIVFENDYQVVPICEPSRASVMLGQYLGTHGDGFDRPTNYIITAKEFKNSYPVLLHRAGYFTGFIGKFGFAVGKDVKAINKNHSDQNQQKYMPKKYFDIWKGWPGWGEYLPDKNGKFNGYINKWNVSHLTEFVGDEAISFLDSAKKVKKPFCLSISFKAPHHPLIPEKKFRAMYNDKHIPRMVNDRPEYYDILPEVVKEKSRNARRYFGRDTDYYGKKIRPESAWHIELDSTYEKFIKNYYALVTGVDHEVGRIRKKLKQLNMAENTVIIFTSDNGFFEGARQLTGKALLYDESAKVPLIVYDPRVKKQFPGCVRREKGLISEVDIAPTILDIAGVKVPHNYPGKSFMPIVHNDTDQIHEAVYGENNFDNYYPIPSEVSNPERYQSIRSKYVRTKHYKYIRYQETHPVVEELFDMDDDPLETQNLINNPKYKDIRAEMRRKLDAFIKKYVKYRNKMPK